MSSLLDRIVGFFEWCWRFFTAQSITGSKYDPYRRSRVRWTFRIIIMIIVFIILFWLITLFWATGWVRGYSLAYPQSVIAPTELSQSGETTNITSGRVDVQSCGRSELVHMTSHLTNEMIVTNGWIPSMPQYKTGLLFITDWEKTPFFDNKASFQLGILQSVRRTTIELVDSLGRIRGTSGEDSDLESARGNLNFDQRTWYINPFDPQRQTFSPSSSTGFYKEAVKSLDRFNEKLATYDEKDGRCGALFDTRADNLRQLLVRISSHLGGVVDQLSKRSQGERYDPRLDEFVAGEGNNAGWFDFQADNYFYEASGVMYAYHGLLQAARVDFADVIEKRDLDDIWDLMETHIAEAAALSPVIVSNGKEDGVLFPDHLSALSENMLRSRSNMVEIRDILTQ